MDKLIADISISIAQHFQVILLAIPIIAGVTLIITNLTRHSRPEDKLIELEAFNIRLRATRHMVLIAIGCILVGWPSYVISNPSHSSTIPQVVPKPSETTIENVDHIDHPNYQSLVFVKDIRVVDLRAIQKIPEEMKDQPYSPATWTRYTLVRKIANVDDIRFQFATTGVGLSPRCLTHPFTLRRAIDFDIHGKRILKQNWEVVVDVSSVPIGQEFLIITEATYWNGFRGENGDWASIKAQNDSTEEIGLLVLFPEKKPYKSYNLFSYPHTNRNRKPFRGKMSLFPSETFKTLFWKIPNPQFNYAYELEWIW